MTPTHAPKQSTKSKVLGSTSVVVYPKAIATILTATAGLRLIEPTVKSTVVMEITAMPAQLPQSALSSW